MQRGGIALHQHPGGHAEGLHAGGVQHAVHDLALLGNQQDKVLRAQVELAVAVELQAVQAGVAAIAPAQLEGHAAKERLAHLVCTLRLVEQLLPGHIHHAVGQGRFLQGSEEGRYIVALHHAAIGREGSIGYGKNLHENRILSHSEAA